MPGQTFAWVHVDDLAAFAADLATGRIAAADRPGGGAGRGRAAPRSTSPRAGHGARLLRDRHRGARVEPAWDDEPAWTGRILAGRAHGWGWAPTVDLATALAEIEAGLRH